MWGLNFPVSAASPPCGRGSRCSTKAACDAVAADADLATGLAGLAGLYEEAARKISFAGWRASSPWYKARAAVARQARDLLADGAPKAPTLSPEEWDSLHFPPIFLRTASELEELAGEGAPSPTAPLPRHPSLHARAAALPPAAAPETAPVRCCRLPGVTVAQVHEVTTVLRLRASVEEVMLLMQSVAHDAPFGERFRTQEKFRFRSEEGGVALTKWAEVVWVEPLGWAMALVTKIIESKSLDGMMESVDTFSRILQETCARQRPL